MRKKIPKRYAPSNWALTYLRSSSNNCIKVLGGKSPIRCWLIPISPSYSRRNFRKYVSEKREAQTDKEAVACRYDESNACRLENVGRAWRIASLRKGQVVAPLIPSEQ
jgi:hypothetical protein